MAWVRADKQVPDRILSHFFDHRGVQNGVIDVSIADPVASSRWKHMHTEESYYETVVLAAPDWAHNARTDPERSRSRRTSPRDRLGDLAQNGAVSEFMATALRVFRRAGM